MRCNARFAIERQPENARLAGARSFSFPKNRVRRAPSEFPLIISEIHASEGFALNPKSGADFLEPRSLCRSRTRAVPCYQPEETIGFCDDQGAQSVNHKHRATLHALFAHPMSTNIEPKIVKSMLEELGAEITYTESDKLTGFHAAFSNGGIGSNIEAKRYRCVGFGGCQAKRSRKSPLRTAARTCNMRCAPLSVHCIFCFLTIRRATRESTADSASEEAIRRPDR